VSSPAFNNGTGSVGKFADRRADRGLVKTRTFTAPGEFSVCGKTHRDAATRGQPLWLAAQLQWGSFCTCRNFYPYPPIQLWSYDHDTVKDSLTSLQATDTTLRDGALPLMDSRVSGFDTDVSLMAITVMLSDSVVI